MSIVLDMSYLTTRIWTRQKNIPSEEVKALGQLIKLQKERKIIIKPCDKGAGVLILDFGDYMKACKEHLEVEQNDDEGNTHKYYKEALKNLMMQKSK